MNNIVIHGRLTRDPELKTYKTRKGDSGQICNFTVAVDKRIGEGADFFSCTAFGKSAENVNKWFHKGDGIVVSGEMTSNKKDDRTYWGISVQSWDFAEKKNTDASGSASDTPPTFEEVDESVPF